MTSATVLLRHVLLNKTAAWYSPRNIGRAVSGDLGRTLIPAAGGGVAGGLLDKQDPASGAVAGATGGLIAGSMFTRGTMHQLRGAEYGAALRDLEAGRLASSPNWKPGATPGHFDYHSADPRTHASVSVNPADSASVTAASDALGLAKSKGSTGQIMDVAMNKGKLGLVGGGGLALAHGAKYLKNMEAGSEGLGEETAAADDDGKYIGQDVGEDGRPRIKYRTEAGEEKYIVAPRRGMTPLKTFGPGGGIVKGQTVYRLPSVGEETSNAMRGAADLTASTGKAMAEIPPTMQALRGVLPGVQTALADIGTGAKGVGAVGSMAQKVDAALSDPKFQERVTRAGDSLGRGADSLSRSADALGSGVSNVGDFLKSDTAKTTMALAGGGVALLGLTYMVSKLLGKKRED